MSKRKSVNNEEPKKDKEILEAEKEFDQKKDRIRKYHD